MKLYDTPIGKVGTLGPGEIRHLEHLDASLDALQPGKYGWEPGDTVDVDEECPHTGVTGHLRWPLYCGVCNDSATVSVPYVVRKVLPIVSWPDPDWWPSYDAVMVDPTGEEPPFFYDHDDEMTTTLRLHDPQPGGVCLVVERAS